VYVPYRTNPGLGPMLMVRGQGERALLTSLVRETVQALDSDVAVFRITPLEELMTQSRWGHRVFGVMFTLFAVIALVLSAVGMYAVTAYSVTQRTQEIGVRMALGAEARQVVWLFLHRTVVPLGTGLVLGLGGALWIGTLMRTFLVQTSSNDPFTLGAVAILLAAVSMLACIGPARRAARLDPVRTLRYE
jgi:ABC-type antimicrobial peptide transport system permease subunit